MKTYMTSDTRVGCWFVRSIGRIRIEAFEKDNPFCSAEAIMTIEDAKKLKQELDMAIRDAEAFNRPFVHV